MSVSTTTGDGGSAGLLKGERLPKDHPRFECLGALDELNAFLGDARCAVTGERAGEILKTVQGELSMVMSILAALPDAASPRQAGDAGEVPDEKRLHRWVRELEELIPVRGFSTPGSCPSSAKLDIARTVCRRAERRLVTLGRGAAPDAVFRYINRLSDLLFMLARYEERACLGTNGE